MVIRVIIVGHQQVVISCYQDHEQVFTIVARIISRLSPRVARVINWSHQS